MQEDYKRKIVGTRIKLLRNEVLGVTQKQLGLAVGVAPTTVCRWETGKQRPYGKNVHILADLFEVNWVDLIFIPPDPKPTDPIFIRRNGSLVFVLGKQEKIKPEGMFPL